MDVAVLGAGTAGQAVTRVCAVAGHGVRLHDADVDDVMDGIDAVEAALGDAVAAEVLDAADRAAAADRIDGTTGLEAAVDGAEIVIDATSGDRTARQELVADVEGVVESEALIAICGATLSVTAVAAGLRNPGRAVGMHFVDPSESSLVEVAVAEQSTESARDTAVEFVEGLDRDPIVVGDAPGFAATRLSLALSAEAMRMVETGVAGVEAIDRSMKLGYDHPTGPLAAADTAGLDVRLDELEYLASSLGPRFDPPPVLREKVAEGALGRKTGEGFYVWEDGDPVEPATPDPTPELREDLPPDPDER